jgi:anti-sigma-K factor RskA
MLSNDREVFDKLTGDSGTAGAEDFITYALFAHERREWVTHHTATHGQPPTAAEVEVWIGNITDYQFDQMRIRAASFFDVAARAYMAEEIEQARQDTLKSSVVKEVKAAGNFWRQLFIATVTAIMAPVIIGLIVVAALRSEAFVPSIAGTRDKLQSPMPNDDKGK